MAVIPYMLDNKDTITVPIKCLQKALRKIEDLKVQLEGIPEKSGAVSDKSVRLKTCIVVQEVQLRILFEAEVLDAIRESLPKRHPLQVILERVFACSADKSGKLIVYGCLGSIMSEVLQHSTAENRNQLIESLTWIDTLPGSFFAFPNVTYVEKI